MRLLLCLERRGECVARCILPALKSMVPHLESSSLPHVKTRGTEAFRHCGSQGDDLAAVTALASHDQKNMPSCEVSYYHAWAQCRPSPSRDRAFQPSRQSTQPTGRSTKLHPHLPAAYRPRPTTHFTFLIQTPSSRISARRPRCFLLEHPALQ